jgi:very-short-patch-repair endonuclease
VTYSSRAAGLLGETFMTYAELRRRASRRTLARWVRDGVLIRLRKGAYARGDCPPEVIEAARLGGRLDCVSLLRELGIFVLEPSQPHVQMDAKATRVAPRSDEVVRHFRATSAPRSALVADIVEAVAQACRCQTPRAAIATLDSALHQGLLDAPDIAAVFARLPQRFQVLRAHLDPRCESGPETLVRLMLRGLGVAIDLQVRIDGVGRVDFLVDGWLIIECDSVAHHSEWAARRRDLRRDAAAAAQGYTTLRLIAEDIMYRPETVLEAITGLLAARSAVHNVGDPRARGPRQT